VLHLERHGERLLEAQERWGGNPFMAGLLNLARQKRYWVRPVEEWRPSSRSAERQFSQLARHLLAKYPVPEFMDSVLLGRCPRDAEHWFRHIGQGGSIRTAPSMPLPLTKRMAHQFLRAPDGSTVVQALRWGQVTALGGSPRLAHAVNATELGSDLWERPQEEWLLTVLQWLVNQPMLDPAHVQPIVSYVTGRRRRDRRFEMPGRTPRALLELIERQAAEQEARDRAEAQGGERSLYRYREFAPAGYAAGLIETSKGVHWRLWSVEEIRCNRDLIQEGREMRHCVATYEDSVLEGECSIWSMKVQRQGGIQRAVTIEVNRESRAIVEVRGKCNRLPNPEERRILDLWAAENGLKVELWTED
jgi:hypothetical protein